MKSIHTTLLMAAAWLPLVASAADLRVSVTDGPAAPATLYLAVFDSADAFASNQAVVSQKIELRDGAAQLVFSGLPAGRYVV